MSKEQKTDLINTANQNAVLVSNKIRFAEMKIKDKTVTAQVAGTYQANPDSVAMTKRLLDGSTLKPLRTIRSKVQKFIKEKTLPWDDNGGRLLPAKVLTEYQVFIGQATEEMNQAVKELCDQYAEKIDEAKQRLGQMFNAEDYPTTDELAEKYGIETGFEPLPNVKDFRLDGLNGTNDKLKAEIEKTVTQKIGQAHQEIFKRLLETVRHLFDKCQESEPIFRDSSVRAIFTEINSAREMNFIGDEKLENLCDKLNELLSPAVVNPDALRDETTKSAGVKCLENAVDEILANMI